MVPGILALGDLDAIVALIAPRPLLIVSATDDRYSADADAIERTVASAWEGAGELEHARYAGPHPLTPERFTRIVEWLIARAGA
jgi:hypothetical protein